MHPIALSVHTDPRRRASSNTVHDWSGSAAIRGRGVNRDGVHQIPARGAPRRRRGGGAPRGEMPRIPEDGRFEHVRLPGGRGGAHHEQEQGDRPAGAVRGVRRIPREHSQVPEGLPGAAPLRGVDGPAHREVLRPRDLEPLAHLRRDRRGPVENVPPWRAAGPSTAPAGRTSPTRSTRRFSGCTASSASRPWR